MNKNKNENLIWTFIICSSCSMFFLSTLLARSIFILERIAPHNDIDYSCKQSLQKNEILSSLLLKSIYNFFLILHVLSNLKGPFNLFYSNSFSFCFDDNLCYTSFKFLLGKFSRCSLKDKLWFSSKILFFSFFLFLPLSHLLHTIKEK